MERRNNRGYIERFYERVHLNLHDLQRRETRNNYLKNYKNIPEFPKVQFQVSHLRHDTNLSGHYDIITEGGFRKPMQGPETRDLVWWSLDISRKDISRAEYQYLRKNRVYDQVKPFLHKFTSSPAFLSSSRLGNFRFRMSISELLQTYQNQFCEDRKPDIRVFETVVYKQEVMYAILIHGPDARNLFSRYPLLLNTPDAVCVFRDNTIIWQAQAICETHRFSLSSSMNAVRVPVKHREHFVWDHVAVAFHVPNGRIFSFERDKLIKSLRLCEGAEPKINREEFVKCDFYRIRP